MSVKKVHVEDLVVERDQVKEKKRSLRRQLLEIGVVLCLGEKVWRAKEGLFFYLMNSIMIIHQNNILKWNKNIIVLIFRCILKLMEFSMLLRCDRVFIIHMCFGQIKRIIVGGDFSKAVVIKDEKYIDANIEPYIRQNEFDALRGKDYKIKVKMAKYIENYKKAKLDLENQRNQQLVKYSTLQYFEKEIGL